MGRLLSCEADVTFVLNDFDIHSTLTFEQDKTEYYSVLKFCELSDFINLNLTFIQ